jgi:hypothetical protein
MLELFKAEKFLGCYLSESTRSSLYNSELTRDEAEGVMNSAKKVGELGVQLIVAILNVDGALDELGYVSA